MRRGRATAAALLAALVAGCGSGGAEERDRAGATASDQGVRFAACMRDEGVAAFPDPDPSGGLTLDAVANGTPVDTESATFERALEACRDLQPAGFTGRRRDAPEQDAALAFARCMRENGIEDFPDPEEDGALVDTTRIPSAAGRGARDIPGFQEALDTCSARYGDELGLPRR
jgi:hypothetical protein